MSSFGLRLRELREAAGLTQDGLAERAGMSKGGIANLEQGRRGNPPWETVLTLARALGVSCEAFAVPPRKGTKPAKPGRPKKDK